MRYRIYDLSVRAMLNYSKPDGLFYKTVIDKNALRSCLKHSAHEQEDNALFYQIMCVLHGDDFKYDSADLVTDLSDVIFYADFSRVFDRDASHPYYAQLQEKAAALFTNRGVEIDFGNGMHKYVAFERSASMSRNAVLSFIREDFYFKATERIRLGMNITKCQLSKLYAYNGLMLSGGIRVDGIDIDKPHRVIVVDNPKFTVHDTDVITVEDDGSDNAVRKYHRVERRESVDILGYDGEGVISKEFAKVINKKLGGEHTSFQIRLPYIKGMLHQIDIHDFFKSAGVATLTDIWGVEHKVSDVDIILTKSMFKGYGWLCENNMSWDDYWDAFRRYRHALYISGVSKDNPQKFTELNYQFLNTLSMTADEFRPLDLPLSFPANDNRHWLTKETEREYYRLCTDREYRLSFFTGRKYSRGGKDYYLKKILEKNPKFIAEPVYADRLKSRAQAVLNRSIIAYNENSDDELRDKCREETEILAILTGLEIDSAKSGVKPDLTEYLGTKTVAKSKFLKYKSLLEKSEGRRAWYEPTFEEQFEKFFADTDWNKVDSNAERLPYLAYMLGKNTVPVVDKPAADEELFTFATDENWKDKLSSDKMEKLSALITDYERCLSRIRACGQPVKDRQRRNDIQRILYSRGQDREYDADMLYTLFQGIPAERISAIRQELQAKNWHLTPKEQREDFLADLIPELERYYPLFSDFRFGGYRVLIDLIADIDDENNRTDRKRLIRDSDSPEFIRLMEAYLNRSVNAYYRDAVAGECRKLIEAVMKPDEAVRYIVALGKRKVLFDLLLDRIEKHVRREK